MIFQDLILQNFGPYKGRHCINLLPDTDRPIVLFGGLNGGGKTTLMDALRLVLYGQRAQCSTRNNLAYADFLNQCRNRHANGTPTQLELSFLLTLNNSAQPTEFRIRRTWDSLGKKDRDTLEVFKDTELKPDLVNGWDGQIEALLPLGISNLFLFDGEQVKALAEQDNLPPGVIQAIRTLLGLELPERLDTDLDVLISRKRKQLAKDNDRQQLEDIEATLEAQHTERRRIKQTRAGLQNQLELAQHHLELAQEKYITEGGKIAAEEATLKAKKTQLETDIDTLRDTLRELAAHELPLRLIRPLLKKAQPQAEDEIKHQQFELAKDLIDDQNQALLAFAKDNFDSDQAKQLAQFLDGQYQTMAYAIEEPYLDLDAATLHQLGHSLKHTLPNQRRKVKQLLKSIQQTQAESESLERYLATAATTETYQTLSQAVTGGQTKLANLTAEAVQLDRQIEQVNQQIERTKKDLQSYSQLAIDLKNTNHMLATANKVKHTLAEFKQRLKLHKLNRLEELVTKHFLYLLRKPDFVHRVQIDTDTFQLSLFDQDGNQLPKHRLSAGEQQLLAIALLWGLANASGRQLPVAIDTPLGRLDSEHRQHLVERYFPQASHQVLLLSTDTEIREEELGVLRSQSAIAREYLLDYHPKKRQTTVKAGYFW